MLPTSLLGAFRQGSGMGAMFSFWVLATPIPTRPQAGAVPLGPPQLPIAAATLGSALTFGRCVPVPGPVGDDTFFSATGPAVVL